MQPELKIETDSVICQLFRMLSIAPIIDLEINKCMSIGG
jgi:hypothetical protein